MYPSFMVYDSLYKVLITSLKCFEKLWLPKNYDALNTYRSQLCTQNKFSNFAYILNSKTAAPEVNGHLSFDWQNVTWLNPCCNYSPHFVSHPHLPLFGYVYIE